MKRSFCVLVGEFALQIQEIRSRDMPGLKSVSSGHRNIGNVAAGRLIVEVGRAIEQPKTRLIQDGGEFRGGDKLVALWHFPPPANVWFRCYATNDEKPAAHEPPAFNPGIPVQYTR
jgi:hypothetical protein